MNDIIYNYILQGVLGAASGYITNDYAINMLFKEYTPFKIGGVIKKTRNEFIDNISSLVENDIINKDKLNAILSDDSFIANFEAITEDFFKNCLYDTSGSDTVSDVVQIDSTIEKTRGFLTATLDKHIDEASALLLNNLKPDNFLTDCQLDKISGTLYETILSCLSDTQIIDDLIKSLYAEKGDTTLYELLGDGNEQKLIDITGRIIKELEKTIKNNEKTKRDINIIIASIDLSSAFSSLRNMYADKTLKDIIKIDDALNNRLSSLFTNYINSEKGHVILSEICRSVFEFAENNNKTVYEIIDSSFEVNLKSYLMKSLPAFTENVIKWVDMNSQNIDKLIEDSIDEVISEADGIKGKLLNTIKNSYLNNLSEKYNIVGKIIEFIEKETEPEKLSQNINSAVIDYLDSYSIGSIFKALKESNIISEEKAVRFMTEYINSNSKAVFNEALSYAENIKISDIMPDRLHIENAFKEKLYRSITDFILSSDMLNNALSKYMGLFIKKYADKNIDEIVSEDYVYDKIPQMKNFIVKSLNDNSEAVIGFIKQEFKAGFGRINISGNDYMKDMISAEIIRKYDSFAEGLDNVKLSSVIDKINSIEGLYKNSSESLHLLIINNLDTILSGSIKAIVYENLNKLNDDELCDFANDFIGRELQPIMYFGGILGLSIGLLLAVVQNAPPDLGLLTVENMITYAFVGYLTNVIAINMIFKPYKEIKAFRNIPFFKHFSLGYIVKNKNIFAKTTAHFVDNNLLSKESINQIFEKYEDRIKNGFNEGISANDYLMLNKMLTNNRESIVNGSYRFTKDLINKNIDNISNFAFESAGKIKFSSLLSPATIQSIAIFAEQNVENAKDRISGYIFDAVHSDASLDSVIPDSLIKKAEDAAGSTIKRYYGIISDTLKNEASLKSFLMSYNDKYVNFTEKSASQIFGGSIIQKFEEFLSNKVTEMLLSESFRRKAYNMLENLFNSTFSRDKSFGDLFDGKLKAYISSNVPSLFDRLETAAKKSIINAKGIVSIKVQNEIVNSLGFLEKGMYSLMGGKDIVDELINKIMTVKIPAFIEEKKTELLDIFSCSIVESFYNLNADVIHQNIDKLKLNEMVDSYFSNEENAELIEKKVKIATNTLVNKLSEVRLNDILKVASLQDIESIFDCHEAEINEILKALHSAMKQNSDDFADKASTLINNIIDDFTKSTSMNCLSSDMTKEDINAMISNVADCISRDDYIRKTIEDVLVSYNEYTSGKHMNEFIDKDEFIKSTQNYMCDLINSSETEESVRRIFSSILKDATDSNFSFIHDDTKSYFANIFVESSIKSIQRNLSEMLRSIEFDRIAQEEIEAMEPRKIHEMFDSFAGKYFKRLMLYGFGGFVFGINMYIGLTLTGLKIIKEKFFKDK